MPYLPSASGLAIDNREPVLHLIGETANQQYRTIGAKHRRTGELVDVVEITLVAMTVMTSGTFALVKPAAMGAPTES